jgi:enoyl-CoA hydratase
MTSEFARRSVLWAAAGALALADAAAPSAAQEAPMHLDDISFVPDHKLSIERRGQIVLLGLNRPYIQNRVDPELFRALAKAYYAYDHDPSLRAAVLFGHGPNFSRGIDVDAFKSIVRTKQPLINGLDMIDPLAKYSRLTKPLVVAVHGDTWNMGHELHLVADVRVAAKDTRYGQDEVSHGRMPGGGSTVRFVREAGWANAMRYILTGDHWSADEAFRIGEVQEVAFSADNALARAVAIAEKIAACAPLGVKAALEAGHLTFDKSEAVALAALDGQYGALYYTHDFQEGRDAEAQNRTPIYTGN